MCVCVCVCVFVRACVRACVCVLGGYFINVKNTHVCYIIFDFVCIFHKVRYIGMKYVTYLVPFFHVL